LTNENVVEVVRNTPEKEQGSYENEWNKLADGEKMVPRLGGIGFFGARDLHSGVLLDIQ
jgi:hypothetical protein